ncbi:SDR family NAD(P)-dependent oxidoreductase [Paenibacillus urinalis]|uniref:SDR family NAD(P)-dependent oxidoreductase n=1 Tax=Paenibacillus urinalis TaxID=521520 RepID=A0AAX3MSQ1_9BACL|nr:MULTISPECIES: SDR family NAD(P)-dependent oxidoreductase [Paenibacillus]WDH80643.1 SDR family NAD(P)-dependent oxidoreductase [Paenibacillus urinalis]WDH96695.1 SDR family NAD(P)-dependent oxidoreductase [Paenibacillus urinalis]WDI00339.1 SDR family NAD(P)-dependent oxidoreductase [Paenibacillus urinalis]GAK40851.1 3-ketoacyl-ACP reductase [Paenibacillus sp. TCA20]
MLRQPNLKGKIAVITGAGSGIGRAAALQLADEGVKVCLLDLDLDHVNNVKAHIEESGGEAIALKCDINSTYDIKQGIRTASEHWGGLDIVFANAGIAGEMAPIETMNEEDWDRTIHTNLRGTFLSLKHAIPFMKEHGGSIIITSSVSGNRIFSQPGYTAYSTSKAGQIALMKMAALELAQYKIRVNAICPGAIKTHIGDSIHSSTDIKDIEIPVQYPEGDQPLEHGPGQPEQIAELVTFLASDLSSHITGTEIYIDGAESLLK